ncbi:hypothetical protein CPB85DRAFT_1262583 [Mucidula mucida]|nr:hypothetical protein CPB85DRAFT_1262583 [Mucidula mucida]
MAFEVSEGGGVLASQAGGVVNASQAGGVVNTLRECSTYTVGEGNMGRGLSGSLRRFKPVKLLVWPMAERFVKTVQASQAGGVVNTLRECSTYTVGEGNMGRGLRDVDGESVLVKLAVWSIECSTYTVGEGNMGRGLRDVDGESLYGSTSQAFGPVNVRAERFVKRAQAGQAGGVVNTLRECSTYTVGEGNMGRGLRDVDAESVPVKLLVWPMAERFVKTVQASQAGGVVNTLRECSTYTVGEGNMGRGLRDVDGESLYGSTSQAFGPVNVRAERFVKRAQASQAGGVVNTLRECSTYTVGEGNMGRGLRDVDGESLYGSTSQAFGPVNVRAERFVKRAQAGQAGGVVNTLRECPTYTVGESNTGRPAHALMTEDISGAGKGLYVPAWGQ